MNRLIECLAAVQHEQIWAYWVQFHLGCAIEHEDGSITIPARKVKEMRIRARMPYNCLGENEKNYCRHQVDKILRAVRLHKIERDLEHLQHEPVETQGAAPLIRGDDERSADFARGIAIGNGQRDRLSASQTP
jgi:hypothetical protein